MAAKDSIGTTNEICTAARYALNDENLIANESWWYGETMYYCKAIEVATMYCLNAVEIFDRKGITNDAHKYQFLGELFYATRDYDKVSITLAGPIENEKDSSQEARTNTMSRWNTIALCWQKMGNYDSAFHYYDIAMQIANAVNSEVWKGIISGNKGQVYLLQKKYDIAKPLLEFDYNTSKTHGQIASAATR
jgi:tetratricopeptide (TPR) repeat protein